MAKQLGLHKVHGKVGEFSYYQSKNGGSLMRSINTGMSDRVKYTIEYANTRLNNAEFGGAGSFAGAIVRGIPVRYRYILNPKATGELAKAAKAAMVHDNTSPWGFRKINSKYVPSIFLSFNQLSKNQMPEEIFSFISQYIKYDAEAGKVFTDNNYEISELLSNELKAKGADKVSLLLFGFSVTKPNRETNEAKYDSCYGTLESLSAISKVDASVEPGTVIIPDERVSESELPYNDQNTDITGILAVMLPEKTVGTNTYVLQELCAASWLQINDGTVPEP